MNAAAKSLRSPARGEWQEARGKTFFLVTPLPLAPCFSPECRRLQQVFMNSQGWDISSSFLITTSAPGVERMQPCYRI
jgi:hypothetical protein